MLSIPGTKDRSLYGMRRSRRRPDTEHPFGYGRELYFWSFIVALLLFGLGCIASLVEGIDHIRHPEPIEHPGLIYMVLVLSFLFEGSSWLIAWEGFQAFRGRGRLSGGDPRQTKIRRSSSFFSKIRRRSSASASSFSEPGPRSGGTSQESTASLPWRLVYCSGLSRRRSRARARPLIGERADPKLHKKVFAIAKTTAGVVSPNGLVSAQLAPDQVVVALSVQFEDWLTTPEIERIVVEMEEEDNGAVNRRFSCST